MINLSKIIGPGSTESNQWDERRSAHAPVRRLLLWSLLLSLPLLLGAKPSCKGRLPDLDLCFGQRWEICLDFWFPDPVPAQPPVNVQCGRAPCQEGTCSGSIFSPIRGTGSYWCLVDNGAGIPRSCRRCAGPFQTVIYGEMTAPPSGGPFRLLDTSLESVAFIAPRDSVSFTLSDEINPATVIVAGGAIAPGAPTIWFARTHKDGDTLTLLPPGEWREGLGQTLVIDLQDIHGSSTRLEHMLHVRALDRELERASAAIMQRRAELAAFGWNNPEGGILRIGSTPAFVQQFPAVTAVYNPLISGGRGSMYYSPGVGAVIVYGSINAYYQSVGAHHSALGIPVTDELPDGFGRVSFFAGGRIHWNGLSTWHVLY